MDKWIISSNIAKENTETSYFFFSTLDKKEINTSIIKKQQTPLKEKLKEVHQVNSVLLSSKNIKLEIDKH